MGQFFIGYRAGGCTSAWNKFVEKTQVVLVRFFLENQNRGLGFVEYIFDFFRPVAGVDRHHDRPDAGQREIQVSPLRVAGHPDGDFVAFADAQAEKAPGDEIRCSLELVVGHFAVLKHRSDLVAIALRRLVQRSADGFSRPLIVPHVNSSSTTIVSIWRHAGCQISRRNSKTSLAPCQFLPPRWGKARIGVLRTLLMGTPSFILPRRGGEKIFGWSRGSKTYTALQGP